MKKNFFKWAVAVAIAISSAWSASAQVMTLDLTNPTCVYNSPSGQPPSCVNWTDTIAGDPLNGTGGGYWTKTYNDSLRYTGICFGEFVFSHLPAGPGAAFGGSYWDGFTTGSNGDNRNFGYRADSVGSVNWVPNQWGVMAGGGLNSSYQVVKGAPYLLAYWGYHMEPEWWHMHFGDIPPEPMHCLTANVVNAAGDTVLFAPEEVYICNHPWPYYGNLYGDGFACPLNRPGDYFILKITGIDSDGEDIKTIVDTLAIYDPSAPYSVRENSNWHKVDLTDLGEEVKTIYFTMETTDADPQWGPNTAVYFCLDKLKVNKQDVTPQKAVAAKTRAVQKAKTPAQPKAMEVKDYFPKASHTGGDVWVYDAQGNEVLKTTVKAGEKINLSKLPAGHYRLRHGHGHIPFKKVN